MTDSTTPGVEYGLLLQFRFSGSKTILETHTLLPSAQTEHIIGRSGQAGQPTDISQSRVLSRHHATITLDNSGQFAIIEDHNSSHGTKIIRGATKFTLSSEHPSFKIRPGDVVKLGKELKKDGATHKPLYCYINPTKKVKSGASPTSASSSSPFRHIVLTEAEQLGAIEISDDEDDDDDDIQITAYRSSASIPNSPVSSQDASSPAADVSQETQATIAETQTEGPAVEQSNSPWPALTKAVEEGMLRTPGQISAAIFTSASVPDDNEEEDELIPIGEDEREMSQFGSSASAFLVAGPLGHPEPNLLQDFLERIRRETDDERFWADDSDNSPSESSEEEEEEEEEEARPPFSDLDGLRAEQQLAEEKSHQELFPSSQYIEIYKVLDNAKAEQQQSTNVESAATGESNAPSGGVTTSAPDTEPFHHNETEEQADSSRATCGGTDVLEEEEEDHRQGVVESNEGSASVSSGEGPSEAIESTAGTFSQGMPEADDVQESAGFAEAQEQLTELETGLQAVAATSSAPAAAEAPEQGSDCQDDVNTKSSTPSPRGEKRPAEAQEPSEEVGETRESRNAGPITCALLPSTAVECTESRTKRQRTRDIAVGAALGAVSTFITLAVMAGTDGGM